MNGSTVVIGGTKVPGIKEHIFRDGSVRFSSVRCGDVAVRYGSVQLKTVRIEGVAQKDANRDTDKYHNRVGRS